MNETGCALRAGRLYVSDRHCSGKNSFWTASDGSFHVWNRQKPREMLRMTMMVKGSASSAKNTVYEATTAGMSETASGAVSRSSVASYGAKETRREGKTGEGARDADRELEAWLRANPGVVRDIGGPGSRVHVAELMKWHRPEFGCVLWNCDDGMCGAAALVHVVDSVRGRKCANAYLKVLKEVCPAIGSLAEMSELLRQLKKMVPPHRHAHLQMQRLTREERSVCRLTMYAWRSAQQWCLVVQFLESGKSNHVVCLDGYWRLVWDSVEEYPVDLNPDSLRLCTGVKSKKVIVNVREVTKHREKSVSSGKKRKAPVDVIKLD